MNTIQQNRLGQILWRFKGTIVIQVVIITIGLITRHNTAGQQARLLSHIGMDYRLLREGHVWHLLTGTWFQSRPGIALSMIALVLSGTVVLEYLVGTKWMLATVITGDWVATVLTVLTVRVWAGLGSGMAQGLLTTPDSGSSALAHAGLGATAVLLPAKWRPWAVAVLVAFTIAQFFYEDPIPAIVHCWAALYGALIGWFVLRPRSGG